MYNVYVNRDSLWCKEMKTTLSEPIIYFSFICSAFFTLFLPSIASHGRKRSFFAAGMRWKASKSRDRLSFFCLYLFTFFPILTLFVLLIIWDRNKRLRSSMFLPQCIVIIIVKRSQWLSVNDIAMTKKLSFVWTLLPK